ncbi:hypothetical protein F2P81_001245 [Scophthalmus maximus]|uniref:Uncharacterized protein n=1 Tax=Scophthalmus maximus TaxID=52904 RepID=A0A6A4TZZ0_SCOMX|nr:hypothetical protein F2P81_001245 [Scophthalmus maximus]
MDIGIKTGNFKIKIKHRRSTKLTQRGKDSFHWVFSSNGRRVLPPEKVSRFTLDSVSAYGSISSSRTVDSRNEFRKYTVDIMDIVILHVVSIGGWGGGGIIVCNESTCEKMKSK